MNLIKEFCPVAKTCTISADTYTSDFAFIKSLVDEGKKDFPHLRNEEMKIVMFAGRRCNGIFGVRFIISNNTVPEGYSQISKLEEIY